MRIGIVDGRPLAMEALRRALALAPEHQLVWSATDGEEAVAQFARDRPDLVLMALRGPRLDGVEATRRIMAHGPCAILIVTADVETNAARVFAAMGQGALDVVDTPRVGSDNMLHGAEPLLTKIGAIAKLVGDSGSARHKAPGHERPHFARGALVAIGASAGGPAALAAILEALPAKFPATIVVVQHVDARFAKGMAEWLGQHSALPVRLAGEGDPLIPGEVLVAGTDDHLVLNSKDRLGYTALPRDHVYRPSIDVFFNSVSRFWRGTAVGVLLTGMGSDGAKGLHGLRTGGYHTIAQDRATSAVYGMPKAAAALCAAVDILPLGCVAPKLIDLLAAAPARKGLAK